MQVGSLFVALGFKVDDKGAKDFDSKLKSISANAKKMAVVVTAAIYAIDRFAESTARASIALGNFAVQTGLSAQKLQQWQFAATMSNTAMSVDSVTSSITGLSQALMEIRMGGGNPEAFRWLGVNPMGKDAFQVLEGLSKTVKTLDPAFASMMLSNIGLSADWVNVLSEGEDALKQMFDRAPQRSNAYIKSMQTIGKLSKEFRLNISFFFEKIIIRGMPAIKAFYGFVERGMRSLSGIVEMLFRVGESMYRVWSSIPDGLRVALMLFTMIRAPLVALLLLLDDFSTWMNGGQSLFGDIYESLQNVGNGLYDIFNKIAGIVRDSIVAPLDGLLDKMQIGSTGKAAAAVGGGVLGAMAVKGIAGAGLRAAATPQGIIAILSIAAFAAFAKYAMDKVGRNDGVAPDFSIEPDSTTFGIPETIQNKDVSVIQNNNITVHGSGDPVATGNAIMDKMERELNHAAAYQRGGMER